MKKHIEIGKSSSKNILMLLLNLLMIFSAIFIIFFMKSTYLKPLYTIGGVIGLIFFTFTFIIYLKDLFTSKYSL